MKTYFHNTEPCAESSV